MRRTGRQPRQGRDTRPGPTQLFRPGQRRIAWVVFLLLAAYAPLVSWLKRDDSWLGPLAVAAMVGYALIIDDVLRRRAARRDGLRRAITAGRADGSTEIGAAGTELTRGRLSDDPGSARDVSPPDQRPDW